MSNCSMPYYFILLQDNFAGEGIFTKFLRGMKNIKIQEYLPTTNKIKNISIDFSCSSSAEAGAGSVVDRVLTRTVVTTGGCAVPLLKCM